MYGDRWSQEEDGELLSLKSRGYGYKSLVNMFSGRTRDAIRSRYRELIGQGRETRRGARMADSTRSDRIGRWR